MDRPAHQEDRLLIEGFLTGDLESTRVVDGWIDVVLRQNASSLAEEWDDLRQDIRARVFQSLSRGRFDGRSGLRTYVHRIAKNTCIDLGRKTQRHERHHRVDAERASHAVDVEESPLQNWITKDLLSEILRAFSDDDRLLLQLVFIEQCSYREVAKRLAIPEGTVKSRMSRCKDRLIERRNEVLQKRGPGW